MIIFLCGLINPAKIAKKSDQIRRSLCKVRKYADLRELSAYISRKVHSILESVIDSLSLLPLEITACNRIGVVIQVCPNMTSPDFRGNGARWSSQVSMDVEGTRCDGGSWELSIGGSGCGE